MTFYLFNPLKISLAKILSAAFAISALAISSSSAFTEPQTHCAARTEIIKQLKTDYSEKLHSSGIISDKLLMELYVSQKGSWTILFTSEKGQSCVVATGQMWENMPGFNGPEA